MLGSVQGAVRKDGPYRNRPVLREPGGETPPGYSPDDLDLGVTMAMACRSPRYGRDAVVVPTPGRQPSRPTGTTTRPERPRKHDKRPSHLSNVTAPVRPLCAYYPLR